MLPAVENRSGQAGYLAAQTMAMGVNHESVRDFGRWHVQSGASVRSDALPALGSLGDAHRHEARVTPPEQAGAWLPQVHLVIANLKRFLLGTFHGVSGGTCRNINEFVFRFNRRFWGNQLPEHLGIDGPFVQHEAQPAAGRPAEIMFTEKRRPVALTTRVCPTGARMCHDGRKHPHLSRRRLGTLRGQALRSPLCAT